MGVVDWYSLSLGWARSVTLCDPQKVWQVYKMQRICIPGVATVLHEAGTLISLQVLNPSGFKRRLDVANRESEAMG
jgi:hypothetical protein